MNTDDRIAKVGMDSHRTFSTATARAADGKIVWRKRLEHADRRPLREELGTWPKGTPVVLEGTFGWGWMSDELSAAGLEPHLASSKKVAAWRDARGLAKSNRTDADLLSELWSQQPRWWEVWLAPPEVRSQREWLRYRMTLVRLQTGLKNRIHAILHRHGIVYGESDLFGTAGRRFLSLLIAPNDATLPESARAMLKGYLQLLDQLRRQIANVTREIRGQITSAVGGPAGERLRTLPGIDYILGYTILAEVGRIERFRSAKHLAAYSLLAPRAYDSGDDDGEAPKGRHVGHAGRRTLKWAWIEAAHGAVRKGGRFRGIFDRRTNGGKRDRNRGYIAVGHELCRTAYAMWTKEVDYTETPPPRPGRGKRPRGLRRAAKGIPRRSRPGTGQPEHPMVAVLT
jgi:transposase